MTNLPRSPHYPAIPVDDAVELLRKFWRASKGEALAPPEAAQALGFAAASGIARSRLGSLKMFGLLTKKGDRIEVTPLGKRVVFPESPVAYAKDIAVAAREPALFAQYFEFPASGTALRQRLIDHHGFTPAGAAACVHALTRTREHVAAAHGALLSVDSQPSAGLPNQQLLFDRKPNAVRFAFQVPDGELTLQVQIDRGSLRPEDLRRARHYLEAIEEDLIRERRTY